SVDSRFSRQQLGRAAADGNLLQLRVGDERDPLAVGGEERGSRVVGAGQLRRTETIEAAQKEAARLRVDVDVRDAPAVRRGGEWPPLQVIAERWSEIQVDAHHRQRSRRGTPQPGDAA